MKTMIEYLFFVLFLASLGGLFFGLIKPSIVKMNSRKRVLKIFGGSIILSFILIGITAPDNTKPKESQSGISNEKISQNITSVISPVIEQKDIVAQNQNELTPIITSAPVIATPTLIVKPEEILKEEVIKKVNQMLGDKTNMGKQRIKDIIVTPLDIPEIPVRIIIKLNADENITTSLTKWGIWSDDSKIFKEIPKLNTKISSIDVISFLPWTDNYGNVNDAIAMQVELKKETWKKINWDNFSQDNLPKIADNYSESPIFFKK